MTTAVDSSILLDVFTNDPSHGSKSLNALRGCAALGGLVACPIVWAELSSLFSEVERMNEALNKAEIQFDPFDRECSEAAGQQWRQYRKRGGSRTRLIADFFIGAHASVRTGRLLTRDRGFFRRYFSGLEIIVP
jgi:predicted nucleic acid-binding protein